MTAESAPGTSMSRDEILRLSFLPASPTLCRVYQGHYVHGDAQTTMFKNFLSFQAG
jgi:hypothetical protein